MTLRPLISSLIAYCLEQEGQLTVDLAGMGLALCEAPSEPVLNGKVYMRVVVIPATLVAIGRQDSVVTSSAASATATIPKLSLFDGKDKQRPASRRTRLHRAS